MNDTQTVSNVSRSTQVSALSGLVFYSPNPARFVAFYRGILGAPLEPADHGRVGQHFEGMLGGTHIAVWDEARHMPGSPNGGPLVPVYRTVELDRVGDAIVSAGGTRLHKPIDIGEGKRVATFLDVDQRPLRLIEMPISVSAPRIGDPYASEHVSAMVHRSTDPERLATFFARALGIRYTREDDHGPSVSHHEGRIGATRLAILGEASSRRSSISPTYFVPSLDAKIQALHALGVTPSAILDLRPGMRLGIFNDVDGNTFHLIEISRAALARAEKMGDA